MTTEQPPCEVLTAIIASVAGLLEPSALIPIFDVLNLRRDAAHALLRLGPKVDSIRQEVQKLDFEAKAYQGPTLIPHVIDSPHSPVLRPAGWSESKFENHLSRTLGEFKRLLELAKEMVCAPNDGSQPKPGAQYSKTDDALYKKIGRNEIEIHTNQELWSRYETTLKTKRPGTTKQAFRMSLNRIRVHHGITASRDVQKKFRDARIKI